MVTNAWHAGVTPVVIAQEALMILENNLVWGNLVYRDYQSEFGGKKQGDTITIRGPASFTVDEFSHGGTTTAQAVTETNVTLQLEKHFDVTVEIGAKERTLDLESFSTQILTPAMVAIADAIDAYVAAQAFEMYLHSGTAGVPIDSLGEIATINKILHDYKCPKSPRVGIVDQATEAELIQEPFFTAANIRGEQPGSEALRNATMGKVMGIDWYMNQNVYDHTTGTWTGESPLIDGALAAGVTTIHADACGSGATILEGDIFTINGVTGYYRATADATASADAEEETDILIEPALEGAALDDAAITQIASHARNVVMHPNAIALCVVPLELPAGAASAEYINSRGMGIRLVSDYSASTKIDTMSFDVLVGAKCIDPRIGCIVLG
jgi:hypothetical protein